jgi:hypothetical protein
VSSSSSKLTTNNNNINNRTPPKPAVGAKFDVSKPAKFELSAPKHTKNVSDSSSSSSTSYSTLPKVSFTDREIQEIRVAKETFFKEPKEKISPRIASIQKMLASSGSQVLVVSGYLKLYLRFFSPFPALFPIIHSQPVLTWMS